LPLSQRAPKTQHRAEFGRPAQTSRPVFFRHFGAIARYALACGMSFATQLVDQARSRLGKPGGTGSLRRVLAWSGVVAFALYVGLVATLYLTQRSLMYFPDTVPTTPAQAGLSEAQQVPLTASDGVQISAWYVAPQDDKPVIVYFHGNGGALRLGVPRFRKLIGSGIGLVALEYRGYGGNAGTPTERGLIADGDVAYAFAAAHYPAKEIVLWGQSLGSGIAAAIAAKRPVGRIILEAPFTSAAALAALHYRYMPTRLLIKDQFRSDRRIRKVTAPLLILHGARDQVTPYAMGEQLFELANEPKHIVRFLDGGHDDLDANGALFAVAQFLAGELDHNRPQPGKGSALAKGSG
jgi:fermentation-respiration switch protein FrsA (DUF1100 family)